MLPQKINSSILPSLSTLLIPRKKKQAFVHAFGKTWSRPTLTALPEVLALRRELQRVAELMQVPPLFNKNQSKDVHKKVGNV